MHRATVTPLTAELAPDLLHAVHLVMLRDHPLDRLLQRGIALRARGPASHVPLLLLEVAGVARLSDLEHRADRLDSVHPAMRVDERKRRGVGYFVKRSRSAAAKKHWPWAGFHWRA